MDEIQQILCYLKMWLAGKEVPVPIGIFISNTRRKTSEPLGEAICSQVQLLLAEYSSGHLSENELRQQIVDNVNSILLEAQPDIEQTDPQRAELLPL